MRLARYRQQISSTRGVGQHLQRSTKHMYLRPFYIHEIVQECKVNIHYVPTEDITSDLGTTFLSKNRRRFLVRPIRDFKA